MRFSTVALSAASAGIAAAAPFSFPLANGFPNLNATAQAEVYKQAGGTLPNGALPTTLTKGATQTLQLIAANELFEVAYFTELLHNVTNKVEGYHVENYDYVVKTLTAIRAQEEVHVEAANGVLSSAKQTTIQPCKYEFPVTNFDDAILLAQTFTDVVLGVLPVAQTVFATDAGDEIGLVQIIGSIIAQEAEQVGYYRYLQDKVPSAAPLLTATGPQFAYTAISQFLVPGSCPNINVIGLSAFPALTVETVPEAENSTQLFSIAASNITAAANSLTYISGQNLPVTVPISDVATSGGKTYFFAPFPYDEGFARGLTVGALTKGASTTKFANVSAVAAATVAGPALIEVD